MEVESKLKEDFEFYSRFLEKIPPFPRPEDNYLCDAWVRKLTADKYSSIAEVYNRNVYLANLVVCIEQHELDPPFMEFPPERGVGLPSAEETFGECGVEVKEPGWLKSVASDFNIRSKDGRTYLATRAVSKGAGTLGYLAVSLGEGDKQWIQKECDPRGEQDETEATADIAEILTRRRDPEQRERTLSYYDFILEEIRRELEGVESGDTNEAINVLMTQLIDDLEITGLWKHYERFDVADRRRELLKLMEGRVTEKRARLTKRECFLDNVQLKVIPEELEGVPEEFDLYEELIGDQNFIRTLERESNVKLMAVLSEKYPEILSKAIVWFLSREKHLHVLHLQKRHDRRIALIEKEVQREDFKGKKRCIEAGYALREVQQILHRFKTAENVLGMCGARGRGEWSKGGDSQYGQIREAILVSEQTVGAETDCGRWLRGAILSVMAESEAYHNETREKMRKMETGKYLLLKNIKGLGNAIIATEKRIKAMD